MTDSTAWDQQSYKAWRAAATVCTPTPSLSFAPPKVVKVQNETKECEDEWLEDWVDHSGTEFLVPEKVKVCFDEDFISSFKGVGFTKTSTAPRTSSAPRTSTADLVTMKSVSANRHNIFFPASFTPRLIGRKGAMIKAIKEASFCDTLEIIPHGFVVSGTSVVASAVTAEVKRLLTSFVKSDQFNKGDKDIAPKKPPPALEVATPKKETKGKAGKQQQVMKLLFDSDDEDEVQEVLLLSPEAAEEAAYDAGSKSASAWVIGRNRSIKFIEASLASRPPTQERFASPVTALSQYNIISILQFVGQPSLSISTAAAIFSTDRRSFHLGLTSCHRVWRALALAAWPQRPLRTHQPLLWPMACAMRLARSEAPTLTSSKHPGNPQALELEYTINPRTGCADAIVVRSRRTFRRDMVLPGGGSSATSGNHVALVPRFYDYRQWRNVHEQTTRLLSDIGNLRRKGHGHSNRRSDKEDALMAPLRPLFVAIKTAMVTTCDGADLNLDAILDLWRLILALTDPEDVQGRSRRAVVEASLEAFRNGKSEPDDLGNFIGQLLVVDPSSWGGILNRYLNVSMAKNVKWCARELVLKGQADLLRYYREPPKDSIEPEIDSFLQIIFKASIVSRRGVLFWLTLRDAITSSGFLGAAQPESSGSASRSIARARAEEVHGFQATNALRSAIARELKLVMAVDSWSALFAALSVAGPSCTRGGGGGGGDGGIGNLELLTILRDCWTEGICKGYFTESTDFGALQARGTSNLFLVGNSFAKAAFCIDRSGSMSSGVGGQQTYQTRFELVSSHFLKMLESKSRDFAFAVLLFDDRITSWRSGELVQNTDSARRELKDFLRRNGPNGGTDLVLATRSVVQVKGAQECFLLTDGESGGEREAVALASESQQRGVPVHCIGVDLNHRGEQLLKNIAAAGGGECSLVDAQKIAKEGEAAAA